MAIVKRIEGSTVHKIQSGQVVVDLCSAVKELVENSIDAGSTSIDVRFRNYGLDAIEVQDNGSGISKDDFESIALKHYTSKLSTYDDLEDLNTYGFRGEALSSLCAVSDLHITTARQDEAPQGSRLDFELSGKLKSTTIVACQRGATVYVEDLFRNLIVRRKELEKNIKREYTKALNLLQAYACVCTGLGLSVSNTVAKQRKDVFRTKASQSTRDNIANVFGSKSLLGLIVLDLKFEMTTSGTSTTDTQESVVRVLGHVSAPIIGGGRQTSDRQMFFVNSRPCSLPQFAKVFNEVYKSYNMSQSPFVFANILLNTNAYDVNVSPDKRTIMLHDQTAMLDSVRNALMDLFENQQQSVPQASHDRKLPSYRALTLSRESTTDDNVNTSKELPRTATLDQDSEDEDAVASQKSVHLISDFAARSTRLRPEPKISPTRLTEKQQAILKLAEERQKASGFDEFDDVGDIPQMTAGQKSHFNASLNDDESPSDNYSTDHGAAAHVRAFNERLAEIKARGQGALGQASIEQPNDPLPEPDALSVEDKIPAVTTSPVKDIPGVLPNAFNRIRPTRMPPDTATITVGDKTITTIIGSPKPGPSLSYPFKKSNNGNRTLGSSLKSFMAPGTRNNDPDSDEDDSVIDETQPEDSIVRLVQRPSPSVFHSNVSKHETQFLVDNPSHTGVNDQSRSSNDSVNSKTENTIPEVTGQGEGYDHSQDVDYLDEETNKSEENARVSRLIEEAEKSAGTSIKNKPQSKVLLGDNNKDSTAGLCLKIDTSLESIANQFSRYCDVQSEENDKAITKPGASGIDDPSAESHLSVTVSKSDFFKMRIIGQFNLGFIIAVRPRAINSQNHAGDEIFIIDQHASDEKYNFERLQRTTTLQNQRLVQPQILDLTAVEEEILTNNTPALLANGFSISVDESGDAPVGKRCTLHALPTSREVTFTTTDLEELLSLLAMSDDNEIMPTSTMSRDGKIIPRPSKVRKLFAMRACRSSIMIGKTLTKAQMNKVVKNMGTIDKPWNCPHGRPTMRHLQTLNGIKEWLGQNDDGMDEESIDWEKWL